MEPIKALERLHEIKEEKELEKQYIQHLQESIAADVKDHKDVVAGLEQEETELRAELEKQARASGGKLNYPALGSVSVKDNEKYEITDMVKAKGIVEDNPVFVGAQEIGVNKAEFVKIALEVFASTGDLVDCVQKTMTTTTTVRLAKLVEDDSKAS